LLRVPTGTSVKDLNIRRPFFVTNDEREIATFRVDGWKPTMSVQANPNLSLDIGIDEMPPPCHESDTLDKRLHVMSKDVAAVVCGFAELAGIRPPTDFSEAGVLRPTHR